MLAGARELAAGADRGWQSSAGEREGRRVGTRWPGWRRTHDGAVHGEIRQDKTRATVATAAVAVLLASSAVGGGVPETILRIHKYTINHPLVNGALIAPPPEANTVLPLFPTPLHYHYYYNVYIYIYPTPLSQQCKTLSESRPSSHPCVRLVYAVQYTHNNTRLGMHNSPKSFSIRTKSAHLL